jgi:hypothetical protein
VLRYQGRSPSQGRTLLTLLPESEEDESAEKVDELGAVEAVEERFGLNPTLLYISTWFYVACGRRFTILWRGVLWVD